MPTVFVCVVIDSSWVLLCAVCAKFPLAPTNHHLIKPSVKPVMASTGSPVLSTCHFIGSSS